MSKEWYVLHTYSGYENKVKENIEMRTESMNMQDHIFRIAVPEEEVVEKTDGVEKKKVEKTFPGYVLVEMEMSDEAWFIVRNTPGVTGFVGSHGAGSKPSPTGLSLAYLAKSKKSTATTTNSKWLLKCLAVRRWRN